MPVLTWSRSAARDDPTPARPRLQSGGLLVDLRRPRPHLLILEAGLGAPLGRGSRLCNYLVGRNYLVGAYVCARMVCGPVGSVGGNVQGMLG